MKSGGVFEERGMKLKVEKYVLEEEDDPSTFF